VVAEAAVTVNVGAEYGDELAFHLGLWRSATHLRPTLRRSLSMRLFKATSLVQDVSGGGKANCGLMRMTWAASARASW